MKSIHTAGRDTKSSVPDGSRSGTAQEIFFPPFGFEMLEHGDALGVSIRVDDFDPQGLSGIGLRVYGEKLDVSEKV